MPAAEAFIFAVTVHSPVNMEIIICLHGRYYLKNVVQLKLFKSDITVGDYQR